ncbi:hypothetical protein BsWGS_24175 [Bradybaena similaris]
MDRRQLVLLVSAVATLQVVSQQVALECGVNEQCKNLQALHQDPAPVNISLYYESLCPYSKAFIINKLYPTYLKLASITNLTLVPYGNANERQVDNRWVFQCQHGPEECVGNIIATCTIAIVKDITVYFPFLNCMEGSSQSPKAAAQQCATKFPVPLDQIFNCTTSDYGNQLEHDMAVRTDALIPRHEYVPWVTLNGVHTEAIQNEAQSNLPKLLCDTYQGVKPPACSSV